MLWKLKQRQQKWLEGEKGTVLKDWGGKTAIALAFPNRYGVGMSNLGFQFVYEALNSFETVVCERVFYPEPEDLPLVGQSRGNLLSVESQRPLADFDLVAFSVPYENDYVNAARNAPACRNSRRGPQDRTAAHPLVAARGCGTFPEPRAACPLFGFHIHRRGRIAASRLHRLFERIRK